MKLAITKNKLRGFGFFTSILFPLLIGLILTMTGVKSYKFWTLGIGVALLLLTILRPFAFTQIYKLLIFLGDFLGWLSSKLIFGLLFFIVFIPISLIMKIFKYDPLRKKKSPNNSYRENKKNIIDLTRNF